MASIQITTLAQIAGKWQAEADSGAGTPERRETLRECADLIRMLCEIKFEESASPSGLVPYDSNGG